MVRRLALRYRQSRAPLREYPGCSIRCRADALTGRSRLMLWLALLVIAGGCGRKPAAAPATADSPASSSTVASAVKGQAAGLAAETNETLTANEPSESLSTADLTALAEVSDAAAFQAEAVEAAVPAPAPVPVVVAATPEQIANWAIPVYEPLRLIVCYDGFDDTFVLCSAVAPDGKQFVLGGERLTLWNTSESKPAVDLIGDAGNTLKRPILSVAISPDGKWLAAGDSQGELRLWNTGDRSQASTIEAHSSRVTALTFSPNSQLLATTSYSGEVRLWRTQDGTQLKSLQMGESELRRLVFLSDSMLATLGGEANIWNVESGKQLQVLTTGYVSGIGLGVSSDKRFLAFANSEGLGIWDVQQSMPTGITLRGHAGPIELVDFSPDRKWIATYAQDSTIRIWDAARGQTWQVIDADGGRTTGLQWLPNSDLLLVVSDSGRVRIWGTLEHGEVYGLDAIELPAIEPLNEELQRPASWLQFQQIIDIRSFPRLPGAVPQYGSIASTSYTAPCSIEEAEQFYRYCLAKADWQETTGSPQQPGIFFKKQGCTLHVSFQPIAATPPTDKEELQVSLYLAGNYDLERIPKHKPNDDRNKYSFLSTVGYRTSDDLTQVEISLLKQLHAAGWTAYTRLASSSSEDPDSRTLQLLQGGCEMTVFMRPPADDLDVVSVQCSINVTNKSLPIPPDSGWIEYDSSTDLRLVANTKMDLTKAREFIDAQMAAEGWLARETGRTLKQDRCWLPYIRGQQDVIVGLQSLPDGTTRMLVGDVDRFSWQLQKEPEVDPELARMGIEAADVPLPKSAQDVKFDVDQKKIEFKLPAVTPPLVAEQYSKQLTLLGWKQETSGVNSDEYVLARFTKGKAELNLRARLEPEQCSSVSLEGSGLLWSKTLPTAPVRISYETWLRRHRYNTTLDRLDEFAAEMLAIPR